MRRIGIMVAVGVVVAGLAGLVRVAFGVAVGIGEIVFGSALALAFRAWRGGGDVVDGEEYGAARDPNADGGERREQ
ncbi:hypothetical protein Afer_1127 [Acidimicrobium ferrooxidans DSM 10331]|uniref:Uncharacterized protein n=1 Tax=Acidimicrobium ferrooxidans (strain DSM 10331 / JCM 15462 / NBRC 103882 / ICP) TaxID=525909 RepID=C7LZA2_ACIFD|nr:hypothetical protein [Acidimicrobium ferrooxidans]ACU54060.1 hypothetical protein Afer_1127 [Acidimicrobium ferrooxidans DSM 10331]